MDDVYLGETVDISQAIAWPDYKIAWCKNEGYECTPPDQIIQISGFMHSYFIDPETFHVGTYYRWSGEWSHGENMVAFYVRTGTRPVINITPTPTPTPTPEPGIDEEGNGPFEYLVARGDSFRVDLHFTKDSDVCSGANAQEYQGFLWLFGDAGTTKMILNDPLIKHGTDYEYTMTSGETGNLDTGTYTGYLQFTGKNTLQDIYWNADKKCFDSPYSDLIVPDTCPSPEQLLYPRNVKEMFNTKVTSAKYSDDILVPITMEVVNPEVVVGDIIQGDGTLWMTGHTSWRDGTTVMIRLDADNYVKTEDKRLHTWTTTAHGDIGSPRRFNTTIPFDTDELFIGTHELRFTVEQNGYLIDAYHDFYVGAAYVMPTPTPYIEKYVANTNGTPIRVLTEATTAIPTIVPNVTSEIVNVTPVVTRETLETPTTRPMQVIINTSVTTEETTPGVVVPLNPVIGLLAMVVVWMVRR